VALSVIDAVWSIGVRYEGVTNVIRRYCTYVRATPNDCTTRLSALTADMAARGIEFYADHVFQNRQRTSTRAGILKAEAVYRCASELRAHGIVALSDVRTLLSNTAVEEQLCRIPGHGSGISFKYFLMLTGSYDQVKPEPRLFFEIRRGTRRPSVDAPLKQDGDAHRRNSHSSRLYPKEQNRGRVDGERRQGRAGRATGAARGRDRHRLSEIMRPFRHHAHVRAREGVIRRRHQSANGRSLCDSSLPWERCTGRWWASGGFKVSAWSKDPSAPLSRSSCGPVADLNLADL
jgi:hypothetical protein